MPIYEYKCLNCGNQLEVMQKIADEPLSECPRCQGKLEKQWSLSGFQFKGTGWYVSDYGNKGDAESRKAENNAQNTENKSQNSAESGAEAKTESRGEISVSEKSNSSGDAVKSSSSDESTAGTSGASKPESKSPKSPPTAKTD